MALGTSNVEPGDIYKIRSLRWIAENQRAYPNNLFNALRAEADKTLPKEGQMRARSNPRAPIITMNDLSRGPGLEVEMDLQHRLTGRPTMGKRAIEGRGEDMTRATFSLKIDKWRHATNDGDVMDYQALGTKIKNIGRTELGDWMMRFNEERVLYHLAGARGSLFDQDDQIIPLATDSEFDEIMVNPLTPPTYDRHLFAGSDVRVGLDSLDGADTFSLATVRNVTEEINGMVNPPSKIRLVREKGEDAGDPCYLWLVSPKQWTDLITDLGDDAYATAYANLMQRRAMFNHPLYNGNAIFLHDCVIKMVSLPVRFLTGATVTTCTDSDAAATTTETAGVDIDRSLLIGGQALAHAQGSVYNGANFTFWEGEHDAGDKHQTVLKGCDGFKKIRFASKSGRVNDHGVFAIDSAV